MHYVAVNRANQKVVLHTLSDDIFKTRQSLVAYGKAYHLKLSRFEILTLNQISLDHLLTQYTWYQLQSDPQYDVAYYQRQIDHQNQLLEQIIKRKQQQYRATHFKYRPHWINDNLTLTLSLANPLFFLFGPFSMIGGCILMIMLFEITAHPAMISQFRHVSTMFDWLTIQNAYQLAWLGIFGVILGLLIMALSVLIDVWNRELNQYDAIVSDVKQQFIKTNRLRREDLK